MSGLVPTLAVVVVVLLLAVLVAVVAATLVSRRLSPPTRPPLDDPGRPAQDRLVDHRPGGGPPVASGHLAVSVTADELARVRADVEVARADLAAARTDADTARGEATVARTQAAAARDEADRLLGGARRSTEALHEEAGRRAEAQTASLRAARAAGEREVAELTASLHELGIEIARREDRVAAREQRLDGEQRRVDDRDRDLEGVGRALADREAAVADLEAGHRAELERMAGLTTEAARVELLRTVETQTRREAAILVRDLEAEARATGEQRARAVVVDAIQRVASEQTSESVVSVFHLPSDEMKGRIIGREGRNIRAFESVTGVNLIIDDTPEAVLLSCFDPVRREVGRLTLERLVLDGRIHPHRIEETFEQSRAKVDELCVRAGEDALVQVGIADLHPELIALVGRLRYRTSYGQNVLKHLVETAHIAGMMAAELRLDPALVKRGAFLHDIGKALTHEAQGSHALIGADLARRYGEDADVVHAIEAHHNEVPPQTVEAVLVQASDACSGGRPGARRESLEAYVKRLERIEEIAGGRPGVEKVFAMQAGREIRVMVAPDVVDDLEAQVLARTVAKQIEEELTYPGQIRVTVVRESRATEVAK